jgi:hypothetical protein
MGRRERNGIRKKGEGKRDGRREAYPRFDLSRSKPGKSSVR